MARDLKTEREQLRGLFERGGATCPRCEYDLTGLDSNWCPECGGLLSPRKLRRQMRRQGNWSDADDTHRDSFFHVELNSRVVMLAVLGPMLLAWPFVQAFAPSPLLRWSPNGQADRMMIALGYFVFWINLILPVTIARKPRGRPELAEAILRFAEWAGWAFVALQSLEYAAALIA